MAVERIAHLEIDVTGPGVGQRDAWSGKAKVRLERDMLVITRSPGMSGETARVKVDDLRELLTEIDQPRRTR